MFVYRFMKTGGTENLIVKLASQLKKSSSEVHCACEECGIEMFEIMKKNQIIVDEVPWESVKEYCWHMSFRKALKIITFEWSTFLDFYLADGIGKKTFLYVVHPECVKGEICEKQEERYHKDLNIYDKSKVGLLINKLGRLGHIAVMDNIIKSEMEEFYKIKLQMPIVRICVDLLDDWESISRIIFKRYSGRKIVIAARADFPFKGYILGILNWASESLNDLDLNLEIISYGDDYEEIVSLYEKLNASVKEKISLRGGLSYDELRIALMDAYVFIGMGTSVIDSAEMGIPVIPVKPNEYDVICNGRFDTNPKEVCAGDIYSYKDFRSVIKEIAQKDFLEYAHISKRTFEYVRTFYSSEKIASELKYLLEKCDNDDVIEKNMIRQIENNGIDVFGRIVRKINDCRNGRIIAIYGAGIGGRNICTRLVEIGVKPNCFIDKKYDNYDELYGLPVLSPLILEVDKYFVLVSLKKRVSDITTYLESRGYKKGRDYLYPHLDLSKGEL